ncbi:conserved protein of unknown function [Rhodovastum atsumiense]|nr:conserved protein of unknown function [Rhodovastum atsumiense]
MPRHFDFPHTKPGHMTTYTWTGAVSAEWSDPANWCTDAGPGGGVPRSADHVIIPAIAANMPVMSSGDLYVATIAVAASATLTLTSGATLRSIGDTVNHGTIAVEGGWFGVDGVYTGGPDSRVTISQGGHVGFDEAPVGTDTFVFGEGTGNNLNFGVPPTGTVTILNMDAGDYLWLSSVANYGQAQASFDGTTLTYVDGTTTYRLPINGLPAGTRFEVKEGTVFQGTSWGIDIVIGTPDAPIVTGLTAATDTGASSGDGITANATPTIIGTAAAGSTVAVYADGTLLGTTIADNDTGAWRFTPATALAAATHAITATASTAGVTSAASLACAVTIDTTPAAAPVIASLTEATDTGASSSDGITRDTRPGVTGTAEANSTVSLYEGETLLGQATADASGAWTIIPSAALAEGVHSLVAVASDIAGNTSAASAAYAVTIDTTAAQSVSLLDTHGNPAIGRIVWGVTLQGSGDADATVTLTDGGTTLGTPGSDAGGRWSFDASGLAGMARTLTASGTDLAGNTATASLGINVIALGTPQGGTVTPGLTSSDLGASLHAGATYLAAPGTDIVRLADGELSLGSCTDLAFIERLYEGLLGRAGETAGLSHWNATLTQHSKGDVASGFLGSIEYQSSHGSLSDIDFVAGLYRSMLGREASGAEIGTWTQALGGGATRGQVAAGFADSQEAQAYWSGVTSAGVFAYDPNADIVRQVYATAFGREAEAGGLSFWIGAFARGMTLQDFASGIAGSEEFRALHDGQSNVDFVASLYQGGLGRAPEAAGSRHWVSLLDGGSLDRGGVTLGIATSLEGQQHLAWAL